MRITGKDVDFSIFADAEIDEDTYFQYLWMQTLMRMRMLEIVRISEDADNWAGC